MKAAFFDFTIAYGGAPAGTISLARRLSEKMEVQVLDVYGRCAEFGEAVAKAGLTYHVLFPEAKNLYVGHAGHPLKRAMTAASQTRDFLRIRKRLAETLDRIDPDVIWVNNEKSLVFALGPFLRAQPAVVLYYRGWGTREQIGPFFRFLLKRRTEAIIVHSPLIADRLASYGIPREKLHATPNAVGLSCSDSDLREGALDLPGRDRALKILLPAARPVRDKGHDVAIRALRRLKERGIDAVLWITGEIPAGVGRSYYEEVLADIADLGLERDVCFLGWRNDLHAVIARSDVVIVPSRTEGFPRVVVEAMLLGVPVCATPVGGVPDAITDGRTGFLVEVGNDETLADRIAVLAADSALRAGIAGEAKALALKLFSLEKQTAAVSAIFREAVERKTRTHAG